MRRESEPVLRRCRKTIGDADLIDTLPPVRRFEDAVYVPFPSGGAWGLFHEGRSVDAVLREPVGATVGAAAAASERIHLYIGPMTSHYGHFITDVLARLWPLPTWTGEKPYLLYHGSTDLDLWRRSGVIEAVLGRFGLSVDDMVAFDVPRRIPAVVVAEPCFVGERSAHRIYRDLCKHVGRPSWDEAAVDTVDRPVFLSKLRLPEAGMHKVEGEEALVEALARRGVDIVFPEELSFGAQIDLFARRTRIMGIVGSALHTTMFSAPRRRIVGLHWCSFMSSNFTIIDRLNENAAYYYCHHRLNYTRVAEYAMRWSVHDPEAVAAEMVERANRFDSIEAQDAQEEAERERQARSIRGRVAAARRYVDRRLEPLIARFRG